MNNKIEAVIVDLDGTLLSSEKTISDYNRSVISKLEENGVKIFIATGRPFASAKKYKEMSGLKTSCVCTNGAILIDGITEEIIYELPLEENVVEKVVSMAREMGIHYNMFKNEIWYVEKYGEGHDIYERESGLTSKYKKFEDFQEKSMSKLILVDSNEKLLEIDKKIDKKLAGKLHKTFSRPYYLEILNKNVSKGNTVLKLLEKENIDPKNVIAFGDACNDAEMLENVGIGVAMENAMDELKEKADYIAKSNDKHGVGKFLNEYLNLGI